MASPSDRGPLGVGRASCLLGSQGGEAGAARPPRRAQAQGPRRFPALLQGTELGRASRRPVRIPVGGDELHPFIGRAALGHGGGAGVVLARVTADILAHRAPWRLTRPVSLCTSSSLLSLVVKYVSLTFLSS